ncbi:hypothetical protein JW711_02225 [Candidatus Woesearchaeota archaeon]|nr:hypothetical protein [Candidatus Woesearchaeota archaeon]
MMNQRERQTIAKEILLGLVAVLLGAYNLLNQFGIITLGVEIPQAIANGLLIIVGFILWSTAFKLWRHRFHTRGLF